jgi:hypothetical protein
MQAEKPSKQKISKSRPEKSWENKQINNSILFSFLLFRLYPDFWHTAIFSAIHRYCQPQVESESPTKTKVTDN